MSYEVEVHPVGDASKAGDAISIRYVSNNEYKIIVVDGGTSDAGAELVEHIKRHYGEGVEIEHVVSTHPDTDHASGLREIFKNFKVNNLWIHGLWYHAAEMLPYFSDQRWTAEGLASAIRQQYPIVKELIELAQEQGTKIYEPFQGEQIGPFTVLSPSREIYLRLVPQFRKTPEANIGKLKNEKLYLDTPKTGLSQTITGLIEKALSWVDEEYDVELLRENAVTAAENESSTILYGKFLTSSVLLTADGGVNALTWAMNYADNTGLSLTNTALVQVPHHGSRSNVTPTVLNRLLGEKIPKDSAPLRTAFVSVPKDDTQHPRKMVINAFERRGAPVIGTQGVYFRHSYNMPVRNNERNTEPFGFFSKVEDYDS